jgi:hypothetical protein
VSEVDQLQSELVRNHKVIDFYVTMGHFIHTMQVINCVNSLSTQVLLQTLYGPDDIGTNHTAKQATLFA